MYWFPSERVLESKTVIVFIHLDFIENPDE